MHTIHNLTSNNCIWLNYCIIFSPHLYFFKNLTVTKRHLRPPRYFVFSNTAIFLHSRFGPHETKGIVSKPASNSNATRETIAQGLVVLSRESQTLRRPRLKCRASVSRGATRSLVAGVSLRLPGHLGCATTEFGPATSRFDRLFPTFGHCWTFKVLYCDILNCCNTFECY